LRRDPLSKAEELVPVPGTATITVIALREHAHVFKPLPLPEIRSRDDSALRSVFEGKPARPPIVRVIVGPARGAKERIAFARSLLPGVPISISKSAPDAR
jgi:hypothetical protein